MRAPSSTVARPREQREEAERLAHEAHGDFDPIAELEALNNKVMELSSLIEKLEMDDQKAETAKWIRINEISTRRQNELMESVNHRERELTRMNNILRRISATLGEQNYSKLPAKVAALAAANSTELVEHA